MYTNINTDHALQIIGHYLRNHCECPNVEAIMQALSILMRNNIFCFGDTFWKQLTGTAMGAPPAVDYAELYFGVHEKKIIPSYAAILPYYWRYIDDGLGLWVHDPNPSVDASSKSPSTHLATSPGISQLVSHQLTFLTYS
jgi:hypothetical protein